MFLKLIVLQFCAHLLADFIFQPQQWSNSKQQQLFSSKHFYHVIIVGVTSYILSFDPGFWKAALIIAGIHLLIDVFKSWLTLKQKKRSFFFIDQFLHIISFMVISVLYIHFYGITFILDLEIKWIAVFAGFILCAKPANIIIKYTFEKFSIEIPHSSNDNEISLPNAGRLIGISERFMVLSLCLIGQFQAVGLLIAAKSILRFSSTSKSEYVLVGTLVSFGIAVFSGIVINLL